MWYIIEPTVNPDKTRKPRRVDTYALRPNRYRHVTRRKGKRGPHIGLIQAVYQEKS